MRYRAQVRVQRYFFLAFLVGNPLRFVPAIFLSSFVLIDLAMPFDAPLSDDFFVSPRFAANAAPAAICCFLDFAGIRQIYAASDLVGRVCL